MTGAQVLRRSATMVANVAGDPVLDELGRQLKRIAMELRDLAVAYDNDDWSLRQSQFKER